MSTIWCHLDPECALEVPGMAIRVPGEFHETSIKPYRGHMYGNYINEGKRTGNNFLADYIHQYALDRVDKRNKKPR